MKLDQLDKNKLLVLLDQLSHAVEELLLSGLTTASESTRQTFAVSMQEASRMGLLRLGGSLRQANEELGRYTRNDTSFSQKRFSFFLSRCWLISRGVSRAIKENDEQEFQRLVWIPSGKPVPGMQFVVLGIAKKVVSNTFCSFDFRLRSLTAIDGAAPAGSRFIWSCVFPIKAGTEIPAEGYLHLPQKQKFNPSIFIEGKTINIDKPLVAFDSASGLGKLTLADDAVVTVSNAFEDWSRFLTWDVSTAYDRVRSSVPGPLDLDVEMQEEVVLSEWEPGDIPKPSTDSAPLLIPVVSGSLLLTAVVSSGVEGQALLKKLIELKSKKVRPPIYGLLHYERCKLMFQPLATFPEGKPPQYLMLAEDKIDRAVLLRALKF